MGRFVIFRRLLLVGAALPLAACAPDDFGSLWAGRWGPPAAIQAQAAADIIANQRLVLDYITSRAEISVSYQRPDPNWYLVAQWGFNIGRQDCAVYMAELFRLARERTRNNGLLLDASGAATAIVTAVSPHARALSIIAPAFGLAGNINDKVLNTYLFSDAAGVVSQKVQDMQAKYEQNVDPKSVISSAAAYSTIEGFYNLCLPQSIEGALLEKIAGSDAVVKEPGGKPKAGNAPKAFSLNLNPRPAAPAATVRPRVSLQ